MTLELIKFFYEHWVLTLSFTTLNWVGLYAVVETLAKNLRRS